jgi:hypothetical protein
MTGALWASFNAALLLIIWWRSVGENRREEALIAELYADMENRGPQWFNESEGENWVECAPSVVWVAADEDEGNAWGPLGEVKGREDDARRAYGVGIRRAEKYGRFDMAEQA